MAFIIGSMNKQMLKDTARAWGIKQKKLKEISNWVEVSVPKHEQHRAWVAMLRRLRGSNAH